MLPMNFKETIKFLDYIRRATEKGANIVPCLLGHTGTGKTESVDQYCKKRELDFLPIYVSQLEPQDFTGPLKISDDDRSINCPPQWLPYQNKEEADKTEKKSINKQTLLKLQAGIINPNGGVVFLDEVNRGHEDIRQALYQFISTRRLHTYMLPHNYYIVSAANPTEEYETYEFDKALINRFAWIKFIPDPMESISYLERKHGQNDITDWLKTDKDLLDVGEDNFTIENMTLSPRITENAIWLYEEIKHENKDTIMKYLCTMVEALKVESFLSFREEMKHISYKEIIQGKKKEKIQELLRDKNMGVLSTLVNHLADYFMEYSFESEGDDLIPKKNQKESVKHVLEFCQVIPEDLLLAFMDALKNSYDKKGNITTIPAFIEPLKPKGKAFQKVVMETNA